MNLEPYIAVLKKYEIEFVSESRGKFNYKYFIEKGIGIGHDFIYWPNNTWEIIHDRLGRVYFAPFKTPEDLEKYIKTRFPDLIG